MRDLYTEVSALTKDIASALGKDTSDLTSLAKTLGRSENDLAAGIKALVGEKTVTAANIKDAISKLDVGGDGLTAIERDQRTAARDAFANSLKDVTPPAPSAKYFSWTDGARALGAFGAFSATVYSALDGKNKADQSNATPRTITKVEYYKDNKDTLLITFDPPMRILIVDDLVISGSATDPSMDGPCKASASVNDGQIVVAFNNEFKTLTAGGQIKVTTTTANQAAADVGDTAKTAGTAVGGVVGGVGSGVFSGLGGAFGGLFGSGTNPIYVIAGCCCCILMIMMFAMR
jgi:hypothetical protein